MGLNGRVRDGNGCDPHAIATSNIRLLIVAQGVVAVRAAPCDVALSYASVAVLPRLVLHPRAEQPTPVFGGRCSVQQQNKG